MYKKPLKKKYPEIWDTVHDNMIKFLFAEMRQADIYLYTSKYKYNRIDLIANEAAYLACREHHKFLTKK